MKKFNIEMVYATIFVLSLVLYLLSLLKYIKNSQDWFTSTLALCIMLFSLWGYSIVKLYMK